LRRIPIWTIVDAGRLVSRPGNRPGCPSVCAAMNTRPSTGRLGAGLLTLTMLLAACASGAAGPSASPSAPPPDAPVTAPPSDGTDPASPPPIGAKPIVPKPGQAVDVHPIAAERLAARVDGNKIIVSAIWTSGVEPCTILDSIVVDKGEGTYTITLQEGNSPEDIACIAIAEQHITEFEIPDVAAGTWKIVDSGGIATPVEVTVG
jgi:hypothetical protein